MIVLRDADLERAANAAVYYSMQNSRPDLHLGRARLRRGAGLRRVRRARSPRRSRALRQGAPGGPGSVDVGAMTFPPQIDIVEPHVDDAVAKGAQGARRRQAPRGPGRSSSSRPCSLDVDHTMECMTEETFGPTLPIMKVARRRGGDPARQRLALRPRRRRSSPRTSSKRRGSRPPRRRRRRLRQRRAASTTSRSSCRWAAEGVRARLAPRRRRHPQVLRSRRRSSSRALPQAGPAHVPVHGEDHEPDRDDAQADQPRQEVAVADLVAPDAPCGPGPYTYWPRPPPRIHRDLSLRLGRRGPRSVAPVWRP